MQPTGPVARCLHLCVPAAAAWFSFCHAFLGHSLEQIIITVYSHSVDANVMRMVCHIHNNGHACKGYGNSLMGLAVR